MVSITRRAAVAAITASALTPKFVRAADVPTRHRLMVFSNPLPGRDAEFNGWYDTRHIPEVLQVPGFVAAQRFVFTDAQIGSPLPFRYAIVFDMDTPTPAVSVKELGARLASGVAHRGPAFDYGNFQNYLLHPMRPHVAKADVHPGAAPPPADARPYTLLALSSPIAGQEAEYDRWYDAQHIPDVTSIEGIVGAQRFALSDPAYGGQYRRSHVIAFDVATTDLKGVYETVRANVRSGKTVPSPTFDGATYASASLMPITERIDRPA